MLAKHLRILIADSNHHRRLNIEKLLNQAGCHGVGLATSFEELMALLGFPARPFDLVLINYQLLEQAGEGMQEALCGCQDVLLYRSDLFSLLADPGALFTHTLQAQQRNAHAQAPLRSKSPSDEGSRLYARQ